MSRIAYRRMTQAAAAGALIALVATATPAHHSTAMFEWGKAATMKGATVERWDWTNPHTFLYVNVKGANGANERWAFEGMSPNHLGRVGWSKRTLKAGDKIDLTYYPLKDGRKGGFNVTVTFPDRQDHQPAGQPERESRAGPLSSGAPDRRSSVQCGRPALQLSSAPRCAAIMTRALASSRSSIAT